jgi:hypothetical protein
MAPISELLPTIINVVSVAIGTSNPKMKTRVGVASNEPPAPKIDRIAPTTTPRARLSNNTRSGFTRLWPHFRDLRIRMKVGYNSESRVAE